MTTTNNEITNEQIKTLATEAAQHGDLRMAAICEVALWGESDIDPAINLDKAAARAECERVIRDASAQAD